MRSCVCLSLSMVLISTASSAQVGGVDLVYKAAADWLKLPEGRTDIGSMHGDVAVSSSGDVYISVEGSVLQRYAIIGPNPGLQVYHSGGAFLHNVPHAPSDLHGFIIRKEPDGEFIYGIRFAGGPTEAEQTRVGLNTQVIIKMTLDGQIVMAIPASAVPVQFQNRTDDGRPFMRLTAMAVASNGDLYVSDGSASDYIHRFDRNGKYLASFGGRKDPYGFETLHEIAIDTRFNPERIIASDRAHNRVVHLTLEGALLGVFAKDLQLPGGIAISGEYVAIAELQGQVSILDKTGNVVARIGTNTATDQGGLQGNRTEPSKWRPGIVTAPHGVAFNDRGDLFVAEFSLWGRVHRFNLQRGGTDSR